MSSPKYHICALLELRGAHLDAGAHGGGGDAGLDILALGGGGLGLDDGAHDRVEVLGELLGTEGDLADGAVDDVGLVETQINPFRSTSLRTGRYPA